MQSNIAQALSLRFPPLAINYTWEPPADAAELHPLCSMLLLARAAKGETVAITKGTCGCHGALEGFVAERRTESTARWNIRQNLAEARRAYDPY